MGFKQAQWFS